jgi:3-isopropylmalate/(R)-2-methylmalate dehydratase small subunit
MPASKKLKGTAWVFGDLMDVDWDIISYRTMIALREKKIPLTEAELGKYCMKNVDQDFPQKVKKGDFIVAGENMGYGHDHDYACTAIKGAGVAAVLCESTNGNFHRNSFHHGLPVVVCKGIKAKVKGGDDLEVDLAKGILKNLTTGDGLRFLPVPDFLLEMVDAGGIYPLLKKQIAEGKV